MLREQRLDHCGVQSGQPRERACLVPLDERRVADHVGRQDRCEVPVRAR
jgi:hypothetical protein